MVSEQLFEQIGEKCIDAQRSQMFGKPCYKINGKAFMCLFESELVFKLNGTNRDEALSITGAHLFDPSGKGRPMKEWVQVPTDNTEMLDDLALASLNYVQNLKG